MAKSALRIRFVFNQQGGSFSAPQARQRFANRFAGAIIEDFAFRYADDAYEILHDKVQEQFRRDARKELVHMAALFRQFIIGANGSQTRPAGKLGSVSEPDEPGVSIAASIPPWAKRNREYLNSRKKFPGNQNWFQYGGKLEAQTNADSWENMFGPLTVQFTRSKAATAGGRASAVFQTSKTHVKLVIGTIRVFALTNITPAMLPALASGDPTTMNRDRNPGLIALLGNRTDLAYRLGGTNTAKEGGHIYRPTLEPFLAYYLTRALPSAIQARLAENRFQDARSSAGRTK